MVKTRPSNLLRSSRLIHKLRDKLERENRIYIIPTGVGCYFIGLIFVLLMISLSYGHSLAFSTTFVFIAIVMVSAIYTHYNLYGLEVSRIIQKDDCYVGGRPAELTVIINNNSNRPKFDISVLCKNSLSSIKRYAGAKEQFSVDIELKFEKRGKYEFSKFEIHTEFPFSLFRAWKIFRNDTTVWVYPELLTGISLPENHEQLEHQDMVDQSLDTKPIDDLFNEYREHRPFRDNDSWKQVDWKLYAKTNELYLKTFETTLTHIVNFKDSELKKYTHLGPEGKISVLATWLNITKAQSISYDFHIREFELTQLKNRDQKHLTDLLLKEISLIGHKVKNES